MSNITLGNGIKGVPTSFNVVQHETIEEWGSGATGHTFRFPNLAGDFIIVSFVTSAAPTGVPTDLAGNTYVQAVAPFQIPGTAGSGMSGWATNWVSVYYVNSCKAAQTNTVTPTGGGGLQISAVTEVGNGTFSGVDGSPATATGSTATLTTGNITTSNANDFLYSFAILDNWGVYPTTGAAWNALPTAWAGPLVQYRIASAAGTYAASAVGSGNQAAGAIAAVAFKATAFASAVLPIPALGDDNSWTWPTFDPINSYAQIDCGAATLLTKVRLSAVGGYKDWAIGGSIQGSNDPTWASGVTTLATITSRPTTGTLLNTYAISSSTPYRYYRWLSPANQPWSLADIEFVGNPGTGVVGTPEPPIFSPAGGFYALPVHVRLSSNTTGASIYYTTDGTDPTTSGTATLYSGPFVVGSNQVVQATAKLTGLTASRVTLASFHINSIVPTDILYEVGRGGYRLWCPDMRFMHDPPSGLWYWLGDDMDSVGNYGIGYQGLKIFSSPDLRNWTYVSTVVQLAAGQELGVQNFYDRPAMLYNAATQKYVIWCRIYSNAGVGANTIYVFTSSTAAGPYTQVASYTTLHGNAVGSDMTLYLDDDGVTAYVFAAGPGDAYTIAQLSSDYTNVATGNFVATSGAALWGGTSHEGPAMIKIGSTYYLFGSTYNYTNGWGGAEADVMQAPAPIGPFSAAINPFQPVSGGVPDYTTGYDSQPSACIKIPGRTNAWIYVGDRWDNAHSFGFENWRSIWQPITLSGSNLVVTWTDNWNFDAAFPPVSGAPAAPSNLQVSSSAGVNALSWVNNEPLAYALYLDRASDSGFTVNVVSEVLASGTTSFTDPTAGTFYYRVRAVNASGKSLSNIAQSSAPLGGQSFPVDGSGLDVDSGSVAVDSFLTIGPSGGQRFPVDTAALVVDSGAVTVDGFYIAGAPVVPPVVPSIVLPWETGPELVLPYCGQNQSSDIPVPAAVAYREPPYAMEEGPWAMLPYASLYPPGSQTETTDVVPPPIKMTDIFSAQQTFPL